MARRHATGMLGRRRVAMYRTALCGVALAAVCLALAGLAGPAAAQDGGVISADEITRSLTEPPSPETKTQTFKTRGIRREEKENGEEATAAKAGPPKIDIRILFETDSDKIDSEAGPQLLQVAKALQSETLAEAHIRIEGHTDSVGPADYNMDLSNRRAASVRRYLEMLGVNGERLETVGRGEGEPVASNDTSEGRQQNRRVTLINLGAPTS